MSNQVYAGKFIAERETDNIRTACRRLGVEHPVVNDRQFRTWRAYGVQAWPSVVLVAPDGRYIGTHAGEFTFEQFDRIIGVAVEAFAADGTLTEAAPLRARSSSLPFPARCASPARCWQTLRRAVVQPTRAQPRAVTTLDESGQRATVTHTIGSGESAFRDGPSDVLR